MAFGDHPGPPATQRQVRELTALINAAGHTDFRDARGPLGLNQRQARGKFTRDEADLFIAQLEAEVDGEPPVAAMADPREAAQRELLAKVPAHVLAAELQERGWVVMEG